LIERDNLHQRNEIKQRYSNPLVIKIPLWNPELFLKKHLAKVSFLFHWYIAVIWFLSIAVAGIATAINWSAINVYFDVNILSPYYLVIIAVLYPIIKFLHELGHAFSAKYYGAEVHELGITFLLFMPVPYVDVSSVNRLRSKKHRILVSAAGIMVELLISALGLLLWLSVEPGLIKDIAFISMIIGGISSLFFNGNPLLKFDGYYILADILAIPNLFQRSSQYILFLCQKYFFAARGLVSPVTAPGEAGWFIVYSISSFAYRMSVLGFIIVYIIDTFFVLGMILAVWMVLKQIILPIGRGIFFVFYSPSIYQQRLRAVFSLIGLLGGFFVVLYWIPVPAYTHSEGVVWMPGDAQLRAEVDGFAGPFLLDLSSRVKKDDVIVTIHDPLLNTEVDVLFAKLKELNAKYRAEWSSEKIKANNIKEEMIIVAKELKNARKKQKSMQIVSKKSGKLLILNRDDLKGRFVRKGEVIGYVIDDALPSVRVVVTQSDINQLTKQIKSIQIRLVNHPNQIIPAKITRWVPEATNNLPSSALATINGGKIAVDPLDKDQVKTLEKVFHIDLEFTPVTQVPEIGQRVYVRFNHGSEPMAQQWYRRLRQVFLRQFNV